MNKPIGDQITITLSGMTAHQIDQILYWAILDSHERWTETRDDDDFAESYQHEKTRKAFREACGMSPVPEINIIENEAI